MSPNNGNAAADFDLICPECTMTNPNDAENCLFCDRDLTNIVLFLEDDSFDLEITNNCLIEYRKTFWGDNRTGKVIKYPLKEISNLEFGSPITRFKFHFEGKQHVLPLKEENMKSLKDLLPKIIE